MPDKHPLKVIIDTNLWISFLIGKQLSSLKGDLLILDSFEGTEILIYQDFISRINITENV